MRIARVLGRLIGALVAAVLLLAAMAYGVLRASLPRYDGEQPLAGLGQEVRVMRDALGTVTIDAKTRIDAMRALGYVHAQERFFEMDLTRRAAAGELSELFGAAALDMDRSRRLHRFRTRAVAAVEALPPDERAVLDAYVAGVNAGLAELAVRPFPYLLTRNEPIAWRAEDSLLCGYAMFFDLQGGSNARELAYGAMRERLPASLFAFLTAPGTEWDAPLEGEAFADPPLPPASDVDLRTLPVEWFGRGEVSVGGDFGLGSNSFAVSGAHTATRAALVANDPHLSLRVPNVWFRARWRYGEGNEAVDVTGATLPGVPTMVLGSNDRVAWAFTNSYIDAMDYVRVRFLDGVQTRYVTGDGERSVETFEERIAVSGGETETLLVRETIWGPLVGDELALAWIPHRAGALDFALAALERAGDVDQAVAVAQRAGVPTQNFIVGDAAGRIVYTLIGRLPRRVGFDPREPADWSRSDVGWLGWLDGSSYPRVEPADGRLWTANSRTVSGAAFETLGDGGAALGARARQIRDGLRARETFTPADLLAVQLDDRTIFMKRWWTLLRSTLERATSKPSAVETGAADATQTRASLAALEAATRSWDERAVPEARSYRFARAFRLRVHEAVLDGLVAPMRQHDRDFAMPLFSQAEGIVWKLVSERPEHLLAPIYGDWDALLVAAAERVAKELDAAPGGLAARTWGERNTTAIRHPLSRAIPVVGHWLDMPARALPGDSGMPRVQAPAFGASFRFAVSPGHEADGYFHMPGGQSGHPLSPYYGAGHEDWEEGRIAPFLPGEAEETLVLEPAA